MARRIVAELPFHMINNPPPIVPTRGIASKCGHLGPPPRHNHRVAAVSRDELGRGSRGVDACLRTCPYGRGNQFHVGAPLRSDDEATQIYRPIA